MAKQVKSEGKMDIFLVKIKVTNSEGGTCPSSNTVLYRTLEIDPHTTVHKLLDTFKERYNYSDSKTCTWGLCLPAKQQLEISGSVSPGLKPQTPRSSAPLTPLSFRNTHGQPRGSISPRDSSRSSFTFSSREVNAQGIGSQQDLNPLNEDEEDAGDLTWLDKEAALASYGIKHMDVLEVRNTFRSIKITDLDNNLSKTIRISTTSTVQQLLDIIAVRFSICDLNILQYSLQVQRSNKLVWLKRSERICDVCVQGCHTLTLRQRFFESDDLKSNDPYAIHFMYLDSRQSIVNGSYPTTLQQALMFAALQMQITFRNYDPLVHVAGFLNISEFLPPAHREIILIEEDVYKEHRKLKDLKEAEAKTRYIRTLMSFPTYGLFYAPAKEKTEKSVAFDHDLLVGVNCEALLCLHPQTREVLSTYHLHSFNLDTLVLDMEQNTIQWPHTNGTQRQFQFLEENDALLIVDAVETYSGLLRARQSGARRGIHDEVANISLSRLRASTSNSL